MPIDNDKKVILDEWAIKSKPWKHKPPFEIRKFHPKLFS